MKQQVYYIESSALSGKAKEAFNEFWSGYNNGFAYLLEDVEFREDDEGEVMYILCNELIKMGYQNGDHILIHCVW